MKSLFKKIWSWIISIPKDKLLHLGAGLLICLFSFVILYRFCSVWICFVISNIVSVCVLALKEWYDMSHDGHSTELADFLYGCLGAAIVDVAFLIMFV